MCPELLAQWAYELFIQCLAVPNYFMALGGEESWERRISEQPVAKFQVSSKEALHSINCRGEAGTANGVKWVRELLPGCPTSKAILHRLHRPFCPESGQLW